MPNAIPWTEQEDELLARLVSKYGDKKWAYIAQELGTSKAGKQCRRRWNNHINLEVKAGQWDAEEDEILMRAHALHGNRWTLIAKMVGGRTDNAVKNRFHALSKKKTNGSTRKRPRMPVDRPSGLSDNADSERGHQMMYRNDAYLGQNGTFVPGGHNYTDSGEFLQCHMPIPYDSRACFEPQSPNGHLSRYNRAMPLPRNGGQVLSAYPVDSDRGVLETSSQSQGCWLEDLLISPMGYRPDIGGQDNCSRMEQTKPPCFTHFELDLLMDALQAFRP